MHIVILCTNISTMPILPFALEMILILCVANVGKQTAYTTSEVFHKNK